MANKKKMLTDSEIAAFCEQLGFMIKAGISLEESLLLLNEDTKNTRGSEITVRLLRSVEVGQTFAQSLRETGEFPKYMVDMVEIGETSGRLEEVLNSLRAYYERSEAISKNIRSAVTYPLVMIVMMLVVVFIIIVQVLPVFQGVYEQLGSQLSGFVQGILNFGKALSDNWFIIVLVAAIIVLVFLILRNTEGGNRTLSSWGAKLFKKTAASMASGRFASAMALMLGSGMDVDAAMDMTLELIDDKQTHRKVWEVKNMMGSGIGFADAIVRSGVFSGIYGKMISIGFKTGSLDEVMHRIAAHYEEETARSINSMIAAIEPTLVAILSLVVGLILMSVMLPLMGIMSAIG